MNKKTSIDPKLVIVALDFPDADSAMGMLEKLDPDLCRVKIGKELFTRCGPELVKNIQGKGFDIFLDLKFHDIPNTVAGAINAAVDMGVWMVNVHAGGGRVMMEAADKARDDTATLLTAVTVLTSLSVEDLHEVGIDCMPDVHVLRLAALAAQSGMDGVVCSAREIAMLRKQMAKDFLLVTPGIRPAGDSAGDQKRVASPNEAIAQGGDYLVIGRPITQAPDPTLKLKSILQEIYGKN